MISCILLSAGESRRFGSPKALALTNGRTIIENSLAHLTQTSIDEIIVVLGAHHEKIKPFLLKHTKIKIVYNKDHILGQTSSFKAGLNAVSKTSQGYLLYPIDFPFIKYDTLRELIDQFHKQRTKIIIPTFNGKKGHPPLFDASLREEFLSLPDTQGANTIAQRHAATIQFLPVNDQGVILSFNTPEEWEKINLEIRREST